MNKSDRKKQVLDNKYKRVAEAYQIITDSINNPPDEYGSGTSHHQLQRKRHQFERDHEEHRQWMARADFYPSHPTITSLSPFAKGSVALSFLSSTIDWSAASLASCWCSAVSMRSMPNLVSSK